MRYTSRRTHSIPITKRYFSGKYTLVIVVNIMKFTAATFLLAVLAAVSTSGVSEAAAADAKVLGAASVDSPAISSVLTANEMHRKLPGDDEEEEAEEEEEEEEAEEEAEEEEEEEEEDVEEEQEEAMNMAYVAGAAGSATVILAALGVMERRRRVRVKTPTVNLDDIQTDFVSVA